MEYLHEQTKERLSKIETMYDIVRIINPINKQAAIIKDKGIENIEGSCYDYWKRGESCNNCISMRSYIEKDTFLKIEYIDNKVILITSTPIFIDEEIHIVEMLKDISKSGIIFDVTNNVDISIIVNEINEKAISNKITDVYNRKLVNDDFIKMGTNRLSTLNSKIEELRETLNEMCMSSDETLEGKQRLIVSQYLDELIVEYMKNNM